MPPEPPVTTNRRARQPSGASPSARVRPLPFWLLQAVEIGLALVLVDTAVHVEHPALLLGLAGLLALLAFTGRGPLGLARICGRGAHVVLAVVLSGLALIGAVVVAVASPALRPGAAGLAVVVVAAVGLARLATLTRTEGEGLAAGSWPATVVNATAAVSPTPPPPPAAPAPAAPASSTNGDDRRHPDPVGSVGSTTDRLAHRAGAAAAEGTKLLRRHRPAAEATARRGIRSLGRAMGRMGR